MDYRYYAVCMSCLVSFICCHIVHGMRLPWRSGNSDIIIQQFPFSMQKFRCLDGSLIDLAKVCDGHRHCMDDELWCSACSVGTTDGAFSCEIGGESKCIAPKQICDGRRNCDSGIDEHNCEIQKFASTLARRKRMQKESKNKSLSIFKTPSSKKYNEKPCHNDNYCFHEGRCFYVGNPQNRFCLCKVGYEGSRCMHVAPSDYSSVE
ncbi:transmembrane protease serine 6-like [Anneissia japonica]|uniref:transmembrane protease serine 6-like n=1 Tax=Anneissia japonica TaxID=1529436 RepID=UPI0014255395|nr:transmembrane protease serine 6-like [Anneissia japonica]